MNVLHLYRAGVVFLLFCVPNGSSTFFSGMLVYLVSEVMNGGLPNLVKTMKSAIPLADMQLQPESRFNYASDAQSQRSERYQSPKKIDKGSEGENKFQRLVRQLWPELDCDFTNSCKANTYSTARTPKDVKNGSGSDENDAGSTSSSEENDNLLDGEMGKYLIQPDKGVEEIAEDQLVEENPAYLPYILRDRRRNRQRVKQQRRQRQYMGFPDASGTSGQSHFRELNLNRNLYPSSSASNVNTNKKGKYKIVHRRRNRKSKQTAQKQQSISTIEGFNRRHLRLYNPNPNSRFYIDKSKQLNTLSPANQFNTLSPAKQFNTLSPANQFKNLK